MEEKLGFRIGGTFERVPEEIIEKLKKYDAGLLCDGMGMSGAMHSCIKPCYRARSLPDRL